MKQLTETGKVFIRKICEGDNNSLISGKYTYNLPFSDIENTSIIFTAEAKDQLDKEIITNSQLGEALIFWFNKYSDESGIDANLLAAQAFAESGYRLWHYDRRETGSGIINIYAMRAYTHMIKSQFPTTIEEMTTPSLTDEEINKISFGLEMPNAESSYIYLGLNANDSDIKRSIKNRKQLHQNIINNPEISIKVLASLMAEITTRNGNRTPDTLFAFNRDIYLVADRYAIMLDTAGRKYGDQAVAESTEYVNRIFGILGDKNNDLQPNIKYKKPIGYYFGYDINFNVNKFSAFLG